MRRTLLVVLAFFTITVGGFASRATGDETSAASADEAAIRKAVGAYVAAFNNHDAAALANF